MTGTNLGNRYEVQELIGEGGMAMTYRARDTQLNRDVAVKLLLPQYVQNAEFVERFRREAQAAASLGHPNIATVYDLGKHDGAPFIVMECVSGTDLARLLKLSGPLPIERAIAVATQVCLALEHAHASGLVHRDIKPGNLLLAGNQVKVTDFGIARALADDRMTTDQSVLGTAHYLSPEQARGAASGPASDLYSLGAVLYEMLTGRAPFEGDSPVAVAVKHINERPEAPSHWRPDVPFALDRVVLKALAKAPNARYASARDFLSDLEALASGTAIPETETATPFDPERTQIISGAAVAHAASASDETWRERTSVMNASAPLTVAPPPRAVAPALSQRPANAMTAWMAVVIVVGSILGIGAAVFVIMGGRFTGAAVVEVPDVARMALTDARKVMIAAGFRVGAVTIEPHAEVPADHVIRQIPPAGEAAAAESEVRLVVSTGPDRKMTDVPNVMEMSVNAARRLVEEKGLTLGEVTEEFSETVSAGIVMKQLPDADTRIEAGAKVNVVVSKGSQPPRVDDRPSEGMVEYEVPAGPEQQPVRIVLRDLSGERTVHNKTHAPGDKIALTVTGKGKLEVRIYNNDTLVDTRTFEPQ